MLLPYVMQFNRAVCEERLASIARLLGEALDGMCTSQAADRAIEAVVELRHDIGIPPNIRALGGKQEQLPGFARKSFAVKRLMAMNPRPISESDLLQILRDAY
jgi:alcohol dehydrogenase class IV